MATDFPTGASLAAFLDEDETATYDNIAERAVATVMEKWANPRDPAPQWVINIAWDVAVRGGSNPKQVTSRTDQWDDITETERFDPSGPKGIYLTDEEEQKLLADSLTPTAPPIGVQSIRMSVPGISRPPWWPGWPGCP
jgi:hypothetical protein